MIQGVGVSRVTCYLALMVEGNDRLEVAFPRLLPRLPLLTPVLRRLKRRLFVWRFELYSLHDMTAAGRCEDIQHPDTVCMHRRCTSACMHTLGASRAAGWVGPIVLGHGNHDRRRNGTFAPDLIPNTHVAFLDS